MREVIERTSEGFAYAVLLATWPPAATFPPTGAGPGWPISPGWAERGARVDQRLRRNASEGMKKYSPPFSVTAWGLAAVVTAAAAPQIGK